MEFDWKDVAHPFLGSGYDVCGEYADAKSIKRKIFDLERIPKKDIRQLSNRSTDFYSLVGETVQEYQRSLSIKARVSTSYGLFSGSIQSSFDSSELAITESSFVSIELCMRYDTWKLQTTAAEYMYPEVVEDFRNREGKWLIENYGGGVVMGLDVGGRWADNLVVSKLYENSTREVSVAMEAAYGAVVSGQGSTEVTETVKKQESIASRRVNVIGGNPAYAPRDLDQWQASVEENPALMDFTPDGLMMIWELFPEYEDKLKSGFEAYVKEHSLEIRKKRIVEARYVQGYKFSSDRGSGARKDLDLYKPTTSTTWKYGGPSGNTNKVLVMKETSTHYGALREPIEWQPVWNDRGSGKSKDYSCWLPVGPPGYVALGVFCRFGKSNQDPPSKDEAKDVVVVHNSLVEPCGFVKGEIWKDSGTGARYDLTLGKLPHEAMWPSRTTDPEAGILPSKNTLKSEFIH